MITLQEFITKNKLSMRVEWADSNPNMDTQDMDHWKVTIYKRSPRRQMTLFFSMGYGHNGHEPELDDVLDCLISDSYVLNEDFENWCSDLGYSTDSISNLRTYNICIRQAKKLKRLLGENLFEELLYQIER